MRVAATVGIALKMRCRTRAIVRAARLRRRRRRAPSTCICRASANLRSEGPCCQMYVLNQHCWIFRAARSWIAENCMRGVCVGRALICTGRDARQDVYFDHAPSARRISARPPRGSAAQRGTSSRRRTCLRLCVVSDPYTAVSTLHTPSSRVFPNIASRNVIVLGAVGTMYQRERRGAK